MANQNGKKGSEQHQKVQKAEHHKAEKEYHRKAVIVETGMSVVTPKSKYDKKSRVIDVGVCKDGKPFNFLKIVQVGKTNKDGTPVKREQKAIEDIENHVDI